MMKVVPADNSCLFTSINAIMNNGVVDMSCSKAIRDIIAGVVMSEPVNFSESFLGNKFLLSLDNEARLLGLGRRNLYSFSVL